MNTPTTSPPGHPKHWVVESHKGNGGLANAPFALMSINRPFIDVVLRRAQQLLGEAVSASVPLVDPEFPAPVTLSMTFNAPSQLVRFFDTGENGNFGHWVLSTQGREVVLSFQAGDTDCATTPIPVSELLELFGQQDHHDVVVYSRGGSYAEELLQNIIDAQRLAPRHYLIDEDRAILALAKIACEKAIAIDMAMADSSAPTPAAA